jgi:hypothetical protein
MVSFERWRVCWWHERPEPSDRLKEWPTDWASRWARSCRGERDWLRPLRTLLTQERSNELVRLSDDAVLQVIAEGLAAGRLYLYERIREQGNTAPAQDGHAAAPAFPLDERVNRSSGPAAPQRDPALFPEDAALTQIAAVLRNAAESGVPFCEECAKKAQGLA